MHSADLIVIGAGPAGMSAARRAAGSGLSVLLLDEQPAPGGQIYRDVDRASKTRGAILGSDFIDGLALTRRLAHDVPDRILLRCDNRGNRQGFGRQGRGDQHEHADQHDRQRDRDIAVGADQREPRIG